jgi:quercetin dioxygenase-like cupin family protein
MKQKSAEMTGAAPMMKLIAAMALILSPATSASMVAQTVSISKNGSRPSEKGPAEYFTGSVRIDPLFDPQGPAGAGSAWVTFEPAARTAWHTHPAGQRLVVTAGLGRVQQWGGRTQEIRPGDVVWIPPGVKHWHGATPSTAMSHIAIQEAVEGKVVDWMEHVTDEQYPK